MDSTTKHIKRVYFIVLALNWLAVALPLPVFILFMQTRGVNLFQVGVIMGLYSVTIVLLELPTGGLADAIGRKKVALIAYTFDVMAGILLFFSFSFWGLLLGMILMGIGRALNSGALDAWYVDSLQTADPDVDLQPALAQAGTVTLLALGAGTLIGGAIPTLLADLSAIDSALISPLSVTLLVSLFLRLILLAVIAVAVKEPPRSEQSPADWRSGFEAVPGIVRDALQLTRRSQSLPLLMGVTLIGGFTLAGVETFWQPRFAGLLGGSSEQSWKFGLVMAVSFLAGVGGNMLSIPASRRLQHRYTIVAAAARGMQSVALLVMALFQQLIAFAGGFWIFYLGGGLSNSPHETLVNKEIPSARRSAMLSLQSLASYIGGFLGSVLLGAIAERNSVSAAWLVAAIVSIGSLILYARVARQQPRTRPGHDDKDPIPDTH